MQVAYSFKDEVALVEVAHKHNIDAPAVRVFVKAAAGANIGIGHPSAGALAVLCCIPCVHMSLSAMHLPPATDGFATEWATAFLHGLSSYVQALCTCENKP